MGWVLVIWLSSPNNFTVYEKFSTYEACVDKKETVMKAFQQADSKLQVDCKKRKPGDTFRKNEVTVTRYVLR